MDYSIYTTDELEAMRDRLQDELSDRFDDEQRCSQIEYQLDMIEAELDERENSEDSL